MPVDIFDDNIFQSANWTRQADPAHRYQQLGGVSILKPQNPTYIDQTNTNLTTRAIDRRTASPPDSMFETAGPEEGASSRSQPGAVPEPSQQQPKRRHRRRRSGSCRPEGDDQATFTVCPQRPSVQAFFGDMVSELAGTCTDVSLAISKRKQDSVVDSISTAIYQRRRPLYLGLVLLLVLLLIVVLAGSCGDTSCKK
jgi:hypothetical protein